MNGAQRMYLSKWLILALLVTSAWTPGMIFCVLIPMPGMIAYSVATLAITIFILWRNIQHEHKFFLNQTVLFVAKNKPQRQLLRLIEKTKAKFNIDTLQTYIIRKEHTVHLNAASIGWPFKARLFISDSLFKRFQDGIRKDVIKAWLAHELSHIKAYDTLINMVATFCKSMLLVQLIGLLLAASLFVLFSKITFFSSLSLSLMTSYVMYFVSSLLVSQLSRAQEYLADLNAVQVTRKPQATIDFLYEKFYQYLRDGLLVTENAFAAEKRIAFHNKRDKRKLHKLYKDLKIESRDKVYEQIKNIRRNYKLNAGIEKNAEGTWQPLFSFFRYSQTWLNTHPRCNDRKQWIENTKCRLE